MKLMFLRRRLARYRLIVRAVNWWRRRDNLRCRPRQQIVISGSPRRVRANDLNIVLVVVDSLRNDALSCNGYFRDTTPFLNTFDQKFAAISASSWTYPSVPSILTGLYPHNHGAYLSGRIKDMGKPETYLMIREDVLTLPEILRFFDYRVFFGTAIAPGGNWFRYRPGALPRVYNPATEADEIFGDLAGWIRRGRNRPFFAYVHLADLHPPVNPPREFRHFFCEVKDAPKIDRWDFSTEDQRHTDPQAFEEYSYYRRALYDNALRYVDSAIERFHQRLSSIQLAHSTVAIVTADHGEQFWEHTDLTARHFQLVRGVCGIGHGDIPFGETIEVPLLFKGPVPAWQDDCAESKGFVSSTDIVPTVLDILGINHQWRFDGQNVFGGGRQRLLISEGASLGNEKKSATIGRYRLLFSKDDGVEWLFDLDKDPTEQRPITDKTVTSLFTKRLLAILERDEKRTALETARKTKRK